MKNIKIEKNIIVSYIFLVLLCVLGFVVNHELKEGIVITAIFLEFCILSLNEIDNRIRLILLLIIYVAVTVYRVNFMFCSPPVILLLISMECFSYKEFVHILSFISVTIVSEIVVLLRLMRLNNAIRGDDKSFFIFLSFCIILALSFVALFIYTLKNNNLKHYYMEAKRIKKRIKTGKKISKKDEETASTYYLVLSKTILCFSNMIYLLNMFLYSNYKFYSICKIIILAWFFYLAFFMKKVVFGKSEFSSVSCVRRVYSWTNQTNNRSF